MKLGLVNIFTDENAPPMGLVSLATVLKEKMGFKNTVLIDKTYDDIYKKVLKERPDTIGISAMTAYFDRALKLAKFIKENLDIPIIIGGVHISLIPSCLTKEFDAGVISEGELTFLDLMKLFERKGEFKPKELKKIKSIVYLENNKLQINERRDIISNLDTIPMPDVGFLNQNYFRKRWIAWDETMGKEAVVLTTRGCPYRCVFCSTSRFWQRARFHSAEYVTNVILDRIKKYKVDHIEFNDDLFTINKKRLWELVKLFKENDIPDKVAFSCQPRANLLDEEMCKILKQLNIKSLNFGFESGSERILKWLKVGTVKVEDNKRAALLAIKHGFKVYGSFILGSPGEKIEDMEKTIKLIEYLYKKGAYKLWHFVMTPFPGTPVWEIAKKRGKVNDNMDWTLLRHENYKNPLLLDKDVPLEEFQKIYLKARDMTDKYWMGKDRWLEWEIMHDKRRLLRKALEDPRRAINALKLIVKKRLFG